MNWILFGIYIFCILVFFVFIAIVLMHIGKFRQYSRYVNPILRVYIVMILIIGLIGGYLVLTDDARPKSLETTSSSVKLEF